MIISNSIEIGAQKPAGLAPLTYAFDNSNAETYYNALVTAGLTAASVDSTYSLTLNALAEAIDDFYKGLVTDSLYAQINYMYLLIGGTAATHAVQGITPGTKNITWVNSPTHSATGVAYDGTTNYGRTGIIPSTDVTINDHHMSAYVQTNAAGGDDLSCRDLADTATWLQLSVRDGSDQLFGTMFSRAVGAGRVKLTGVTDSRGFWIATRLTELEAFKNGASQGTQAGTSGSLPAVEIYVGGQNNGGTYATGTTRGHSFYSVGDDMTPAEAANFNTRVQALQTSLGRNV